MKTISTIDINITGRCNYDCGYCFGELDNRGDMTFENFDRALLLAKLLNANTIEFCGGEPLLHKSFKKFVEMAKKEGFDLILRTNGILLKDNIEFIAGNFKWVGISLDGLEDANNFHRKSKQKLSAKEKFDIPISNIFKLKKANPALQIVLATVVSKISCDHIKEFSSYILNEKLPIDRWKLYHFLPNYNRALINKEKYFISKDKFLSLKEKLGIKKFSSRGIEVIFFANSSLGGGCLIIRQNGDVVLNAKVLCSLCGNSMSEVIDKLDEIDFDQVKKNKYLTYSSYK